MGIVEKFFGGAFLLILVYLLVKDSSSVNSILNGLADFNVKTFSVLQGNRVGV